MAHVVVGRPDEADPEAVREIPVADPVEGSMAGLDLDQPFHVRVAVRPVPWLVGVRDDQHVLDGIVAAQAGVEFVEQGGFLVGHSQAARHVPEEDVVVAAVRQPRRPLEAQDRRETAGSLVLLNHLLQGLPFEIVHPDVVLGEAEEVEPRDIPAEPVVPVRGTLPFSEARVAMGLAPVDAVRGSRLDEDWIAGAAHRAVTRPHFEAVHAGRIDPEIRQLPQGRTARRETAERFPVEQHLQLRGITR